MRISANILSKAVEAKIINQKQADALLALQQNQPEHNPSFNTTHVLYYLGGLIAIAAMSLLMNLGWERFGGWGLFALSLLYATAGLYLSSFFQHKHYPRPAGICATFVVALTPLAIYGLQQGMGWWPDDTIYPNYHHYIRWHWIFMESGTLVVGLILAWIYRYPFMMMPIALTLWYMSMDLPTLIADSDDFHLRTLISLYFGLATLLLAFWVDLKSRKTADYAFWLYIFGVLTFWLGLSSQQSESELAKFFYLCINLLLMGLGLILVRKVFVIFGGLGITFYLAHLANTLFKNSLLFPPALTLIGLSVIYLGILWQKHEAVMSQRLQSLLPKSLQELLQARQSS